MPADTPSDVNPEDARSEEFWTWFDTKKEHRRRRKVIPATESPRMQHAKLPGFAITGSGRRKKPTVEQRREILNRQNNRCLYCDNEFGAEVRRKMMAINLRLHWDHFVPYSYGLTNGGTNWVAACHVCNGIKSARMFDSVAEAQAYIRERWDQKGYELDFFPHSVPKLREAPRSLDPGKIPAEIARIAQYVSDSLEENMFPVSASAVTIRGASMDQVRSALNALFEGGFITRARSVGATRYVSAYPYVAPAVIVAPSKKVQIYPNDVTCPKCNSKPPQKCTNRYGVAIMRYHSERVRASEMAATQ